MFETIRSLAIFIISIPLAMVIGVIIEFRDWRDSLVSSLEDADWQQKKFAAEDEVRRLGR